MYVCMYVCMCVCMYRCVYIYIYIYIYICMTLHPFLCKSTLALSQVGLDTYVAYVVRTGLFQEAGKCLHRNLLCFCARSRE